MMTQELHVFTRRTFLTIFATAGLILLAVGFGYRRIETERLGRERQTELTLVGEMKSRQVQQWCGARQGDAYRVATSPSLRQNIDAARLPGAVNADAALRQRLHRELMGSAYAAAVLFAPDGHILATTDDAPQPISPATRRAVEEAFAGRGVIMSYSFRTPDGGIAVDFATAIRDADGYSPAVVLLRTDVRTFLVPLIQFWPKISRSSETVIVQREGDDAVFLNVVQARPGTAMPSHLPLTLLEVPAVQAVLGRRGAFEGRDYADREVLADLRAIPGTPWFLVTKVDADVIQAEVDSHGGSLALLIGLGILAIMVATGYLYGRHLAVVLRDSQASDRHRYEAEEAHRVALRESEERLSLALAAAKQGLYDFNVQTGDCIVSEGYSRMLGHDPAEFHETLAAWWERLHPDDCEEATLAYEDCLAGRRDEWNAEFRQRTKDGGWVWIRSLGKVVRDSAAGRPLRLIGTHADITERRRVEDGLRLFRALIDQSTDVLEILDPDTGRFLDFNERCCLALGYSREELLALSILDIDLDVTPSMVTKGVTDWRNLDVGKGVADWRNQNVRLWQSRHRRKNGSTFPVEVSIRYVHLDRDYAVCVVRDTTDRERTEATLRLQGAALDAAGDAIVITDRSGTIQWVNSAFTRLTGYATEEVLGKNPRDLVKSGEHAPAFYQEFWETILAGRTWRGEMSNRRKDGHFYSEEQTVTPIQDASGAIAHFIAIKKDTTERLQLEAQFRQAQKMESVGRLASGIAHDFNNLLTVINGTSDLVLAQLGPGDPLREDLQEIFHAGERAAALTRQLLAFSRQQVLAPRVMNVNAIVTGMEGLLRRLLGEDIDLVVMLAPDLNHVMVDAGQIEQVISNVAVNARDAMPEGGQLTIETQNVTIDENDARGHGDDVVPPGSYVQLAMIDSGVGMDRATRARVFEPFFTTKAPDRGTGLGLSTVYGIVKQSHGFIQLDSEVGQGTTFTFWLPQVTDAATMDQPTPSVKSSSATETILVVEDNAGLRKLATRFLEPAGYTVLQAASGEEALSVLEHQEDPVHLLLSDVVMPGMSGRQLAEQLAQTRPEMRALYMSGYTADTVVRHGVLDGQVAFLHKPFTAKSLRQKVREVLDSPV